MSNVVNERLISEFMENLYLGLTGGDVKKLQQKLQKLDLYTGPIDGLFGLGVEQAVKDFQDSQGFALDGVAGVSVLVALGLLTVERDPLE